MKPTEIDQCYERQGMSHAQLLKSKVLAIN